MSRGKPMHLTPAQVLRMRRGRLMVCWLRLSARTRGRLDCGHVGEPGAGSVVLYLNSSPGSVRVCTLRECFERAVVAMTPRLEADQRAADAARARTRRKRQKVLRERAKARDAERARRERERAVGPVYWGPIAMPASGRSVPVRRDRDFDVDDNQDCDAWVDGCV